MARPVSMTGQRLAILKFIVAYHAVHKFSPSMREICVHVDSLRNLGDIRNTSISVIRYHFDMLIKMNYLIGEPRLARAYAPTAEGIQFVEGNMPKKYETVYCCTQCNRLCLPDQVSFYSSVNDVTYPICPQDGALVKDVTATKRGAEFLAAANGNEKLHAS